MKWIADENVDLDIVLRLRTTGHDVVFIGESQSGMDDKDILELADSEQRIVITSDKDLESWFIGINWLTTASCCSGLLS